MKLIFSINVTIKAVYSLILSFLVVVTMHAQSSQNNKFAVSFQYLKKKVKCCKRLNQKESRNHILY